jgi:hypothetical protein
MISVQFLSSSRNSPHFMQHKSSLPCSQNPNTSPFHEPDQYK